MRDKTVGHFGILGAHVHLYLIIGCFVLFSVGCGVKYYGPRVVDEGVRFSLKAPDAKKVTVSGSFNQWDTGRDTLAGPDENGIWNIDIPLAEGRYEYLFFIDDGKWVLDPDSPSVEDGLGGRNSVFVLNRP